MQLWQYGNCCNQGLYRPWKSQKISHGIWCFYFLCLRCRGLGIDTEKLWKWMLENFWPSLYVIYRCWTKSERSVVEKEIESADENNTKKSIPCWLLNIFLIEQLFRVHFDSFLVHPVQWLWKATWRPADIQRHRWTFQQLTAIGGWMASKL